LADFLAEASIFSSEDEPGGGSGATRRRAPFLTKFWAPRCRPTGGRDGLPRPVFFCFSIMGGFGSSFVFRLVCVFRSYYC
jgi:hypothetical protein